LLSDESHQVQFFTLQYLIVNFLAAQFPNKPLGQAEGMALLHRMALESMDEQDGNDRSASFIDKDKHDELSEQVDMLLNQGLDNSLLCTNALGQLLQAKRDITYYRWLSGAAWALIVVTVGLVLFRGGEYWRSGACKPL
jgi:hypothetical protein